MIAETLVDAQLYAQKLREESAAREQELRDRLQEEARRQSARLSDYARQLTQLRGTIQTLLQELDARVQEAEEQIASAAESAPDPELNLTLFLKKTGTEE